MESKKVSDYTANECPEVCYLDNLFSRQFRMQGFMNGRFEGCKKKLDLDRRQIGTRYILFNMIEFSWVTNELPDGEPIDKDAFNTAKVLHAILSIVKEFKLALHAMMRHFPPFRSTCGYLKVFKSRSPPFDSNWSSSFLDKPPDRSM